MGRKDELGKILNEEIRLLSFEGSSSVRGAGGENDASGGFTRSDSSRSILDDDACDQEEKEKDLVSSRTCERAKRSREG